MEIGTTGLPGPSAVTSSTTARGKGDSAFAAALGIFGVNGLGPLASQAIPPGVVSSDAALLTRSHSLSVGGSSPESELDNATSPFPGLSAIVEPRTTGLPLGQPAPFVQEGLPFGASSSPAAGDVAGDMEHAISGQAAPAAAVDMERAVTGQAAPVAAGQPALLVARETEPVLPQTVLPDQGSLLSNVAPGNATRVAIPELAPGLQQAGVREAGKPRSIAPSASATPVSLPAIVAPEAGKFASKDGLKTFGKPVVAIDQPLPAIVSLSEIQAGRPAGPDQIVDAPIASSVEGAEMPPAQPDLLDQQVPVANAMLTDPKIAPVVRSNDAAQASITASAQSIQGRAHRVPPGEGKEVAPENYQRMQAAANEASETPNVNFDLASEPAAEPSTRMMHNAALDRAPLQPNAAPAPLPPAQPGGQAVAAPLPAAGPMPTTTVPQPPVPATQAEASPMVSFQADKVAREMGIQIARRVASGGDELVIRLDPAELGRINIRMSVNEQGQLRAVVAADAPSVVETIRSDISELTRALEQAGVRTDSQSFRFDRGGNGDPGGQWQQRYQQQNSANRNGESSGIAMADDETAYRPLAMNGRINMMA